jgi:DNA-binding LacI/PurR family transcriptional regulator
MWLFPSQSQSLRLSLSRSPRVAEELTRGQLQAGARFDAIAASSDSLALGAMRALHKAGLRVPDDVAIAGFHDEMFSASLPVSLTTVRHPPDIDQMVFELLMEQITRGSHGDDEEPPAPRKIVRTPTLVRRESTGFSDAEMDRREAQP